MNNYYPPAPYPPTMPNYFQNPPVPNYPAETSSPGLAPGSPPAGFMSVPEPPNPPGSPKVVVIPYTDYTTMAQIEFMARENERLNCQLHQKEQREQALTEVYEDWDHSLFVLGPSGHPIKILSCKPEACYHIISKPPSQCKDEYTIYLKGIDSPLRISAKDYLNDRKLFAALQELPGVTVFPTRLPLRVLMSLLRGVFGFEMTTPRLDYYGGWKQSDDGSIHFWRFNDGRTHLYPQWVDEAYLLPEYSPAYADAAARQFYRVFAALQEPFVRYFTFIWFHLAASHTLLKLLGFPAPMSVSFFTPERDAQSFIKRLLTWNRDRPLALDLLPADFVDELLSRKDQPLLVVDHSRLPNAAQNARTLEEAIVTHQVPWKSNRETLTFPLQAPIAICTDRASALTCAPEVINLDLGLKDFDRKLLKEVLGQPINSQEYREAFAAFTEAHVSDLCAMLDRGLSLARELAFDEMSEGCVAMLALFIGMTDFLETFFKSCNQVVPPVDLSDDALIVQLRSLLCQTSEKASLLSIPDMFAAIAREQIRKGILTPTLKSKGGVPLPTTVFYDDQLVYFPTPAFRSVCRAIGQSQPTILHALMDEGALSGKPTNSTTPQTRIRITGLYRPLPVYAVDRTLIEPFGDQVFEEEF